MSGSGYQRMERIQLLQHKGKKILHLNFANCSVDEVLQTIEMSKAAIRT
jgi:hypothetical protein